MKPDFESFERGRAAIFKILEPGGVQMEQKWSPVHLKWSPAELFNDPGGSFSMIPGGRFE